MAVMGFLDVVWHVVNAWALVVFFGATASILEWVKPPRNPGLAQRAHRLTLVWLAPALTQLAAWLIWARDGKMLAYVLVSASAGLAVAVARGFWK
jgi:hypothetical protein